MTDGPLEDLLFGDSSDAVFRGNVGRLFGAFAALLKDTGLRSPKPNLSQARADVLATMKAFNRWRITVLDLPSGGISAATQRYLTVWARKYSALRSRVAEHTSVRAPRVADVTAVESRGFVERVSRPLVGTALLVAAGLWAFRKR